MKYNINNLLILIILLLANSIFAQDYQNICPPDISLYRNPSNGLLAFRIDSVQPNGTSDTVYISYRAIRFISDTGCLDTTSGSVLGRKIYKTQAGWFYFFNRDGDTVKINSQASLNQSWKFCPLPGNSYVEAKVTSVITDSVLGYPDDVKVITFQAKNSGNINISHILDQKFIKLSKHHGLSLMLDVFSVPNDTTFYVLAGQSNPAAGVQNLTWQEVYNYAVGDEFHFAGWATTAGWFKIYKVLARTDYGNDSVKYTMELY